MAAGPVAHGHDAPTIVEQPARLLNPNEEGSSLAVNSLVPLFQTHHQRWSEKTQQVSKRVVNEDVDSSMPLAHLAHHLCDVAGL